MRILHVPYAPWQSTAWTGPWGIASGTHPDRESTVSAGLKKDARLPLAVHKITLCYCIETLSIARENSAN